MQHCFSAADILLPNPHLSLKKWACVACDQYSSQPDYWERVAQFVGEAPSAYHLILPESRLTAPQVGTEILEIDRTMERYLQEDVFQTCKHSFVYVERTLSDGRVRRGLVGKIDLDDYDYDPAAGAAIRATEGTVAERIPPRVRVRQHAPLELPHILLLCDDPEDLILSAAREVRDEALYSFDLMEDGGHVAGWRIFGIGASVVNGAVSRYLEGTRDRLRGPFGTMAFAVGDGNHSLAAAKTCYERLKAAHPGEDFSRHPARYALVELENIRDPAQRFEPIHRVLEGVDAVQLKAALRDVTASEGFPLKVLTVDGSETLYLDRTASPLAVGVLQPVLDRFLARSGGTLDYIHGADVVRQLSAKPGTVGLVLPPMDKADLFPGVLAGGVLPRKTFSMGNANEKRFYLEGRRIR